MVRLGFYQDVLYGEPRFVDRCGSSAFAHEKVANPKLFHYKEKMIMFTYRMKHIPGRKHMGTDVSSSYPGNGKELIDGVETSKAKFKQTWKHCARKCNLSQQFYDTALVIKQINYSSSTLMIEYILKLFLHCSVHFPCNCHWNCH